MSTSLSGRHSSNCSRCLAAVPDIARFCPNCGLPTTPEPAQPSAESGGPIRGDSNGPTPHAGLDSFVCPVCGDASQVQKVSAIVRAGTSTHAYEGSWAGSVYTFGEGGGPSVLGGYSRVEGGSQTELSRWLSPPAEPTAAFRPSWWAIGGLVIGALGLLVSLTDPTAAGDFGFWFVVTAVAGYFVYRAWQRYEQQRQRAAAEHPAWERAMVRWEQLFYCFRCDRVFTPGDDASAPPHAMMAFLYRQDHDPSSRGGGDGPPPPRPSSQSGASSEPGRQGPGNGQRAEGTASGSEPARTTVVNSTRGWTGSDWVMTAIVLVTVLVLSQFFDMSLFTNNWLRLGVFVFLGLVFLVERLGVGRPA